MVDSSPGVGATPGTATRSDWSSQQHPQRERYDAWAQVLSEYFLPWTVRNRAVDGFRARVRQRQIGQLRFLRCQSDPLAGFRSGAELGRTHGDFYNILYVVDGCERLRFEGQETVLESGQYVLWDSAHRMDFEVQRPLDKLTLMVPEPMLRAVLPNAADYVGIPLDGRRGLSSLFGHHLCSLNRALWTLPEADAACIVAPTLALFAQTCLRTSGHRRPHSRELLMQQLRDYIETRLGDPRLTPTRIAADNRISLRYLHRIFSEQQLTVADWVRQQRLERCHLALSNPALAHYSITQIALQWGFTDAGHFGRLFRARYDISPRGFRQQRLGAAGPR
jgi:AraC-like DNA-binding protein